MKKLSRYGMERLKSLSDQLVNYGEFPEPELLHRIRLDVKKIKAILNVTEFCVKGFDAHKLYLPFRTIFRRAGEIRQADVLNELSQIHNIKSQHVRDVKALLVNQELVPTFQNDLPKFLYSLQKKRAKLKDFFKEVKHSSFKEYLSLKNDDLRKQLYPKLNQRVLHKARKIVKEILYLSAITKKSKQRLDPFYDKLQELIGQGHDKQNVMALMNTDKNSRELKQLKGECRIDIKNIKVLIKQFYIK